MRLRTLPVSVAGVIAGTALAIMLESFKPVVAALCLAFAVLAQIASNFANEYYDFRAGLDRPGREGPRRGVTEGDITPGQMQLATFVTLSLACAVGCCLIPYGGWWLLAAGAAIALGALAYSAGPYPLSRHGLGEVAVILFFGIVPVTLTCYLQTLQCYPSVIAAGVAVGLMGANVLIVNNYRDYEADINVGKLTLAAIIGRDGMAWLYLANGYLAMALLLPVWLALPTGAAVIPAVYLALHTALWFKISDRRGRALNPLLGMTAMLMLLCSLGLLAAAMTLSGTHPHTT